MSGGPRRVRLYVTRFDPWSVTKAAFILSLTIAIVLVVAVTAVWFILDRTGVIESLSGTVTDVVGSTSGLDLVTSLGFSQVIGSTLILASVEIVLVSTFAGLFTILYNLTVGITGGVEVVLSEDA
ncbi:MAG: DUF3566 domain-containing protein [Candidatus Nanopelagicales bacterium]|nr:DUF3566 domain-containing protein [Actinomycetota bacterium]MBT5500967.1 DUF3566 domain-containing protein [Actinomycetota bacterium]MBT5807352.1 DUF3566 domain-containing protein [Actinomycetota bacterium]MDA9890626.1 DUF3566 domain-containing protein [Actinomycetota bacterium]MDB9921331.1 DUF3566 domain-containing protein [Actinomycetota bacterium]